MQPSTGEFRSVQILEVQQETKGVKTFVLGDEIEYKAGQFLTVLSPDGTQRRSYSFSTAPKSNKHAAITIKRVDNGLLSRHLIDHIKAGDSIQVSGPFGFFTLPEGMGDYNQVVFLAAGIGITPILSLLKSLLSTYPGVHATLIYSNGSIESTVFYEELKQLQSQYSDILAIDLLFSNSPDLARARHQ